MESLRSAVVNNAEWCDVVCRTHGIETSFGNDAWTSRVRPPTFYPDAVTLVPDCPIPELLARIDTSVGCSIKDSFASLELSSFGFRVLFDAEWIVRTATPLLARRAGQEWEAVREPDVFAMWERAWRGDDGPRNVLRAELLDDDSVAVLSARRGDRVFAGAVLNRASEVVGISNVFTRGGSDSETWACCVALAGTLFPGSVLVGYESGAAIDLARALGFETAGHLRVWRRED